MIDTTKVKYNEEKDSLEGFEEQVVGKNKEEEFDVNVTFPENYGEKSLAGKPAVFKYKA